MPNVRSRALSDSCRESLDGGNVFISYAPGPVDAPTGEALRLKAQFELMRLSSKLI